MTLTTRKHDQIPSDAGVTFEGFEDIYIESRVNTKQEFKSAMDIATESTDPIARVILGDWGEGKTDTYQRYIKPHADETGNSSVFTTASTIDNSYETPDVKEIIEKTPLEAVRFLVCLLYSVKQESGITEIPQPSGYTDPIDYVSDGVSALRENSENVFVFIDEFEELLYSDRTNKILSGLKETINPPQETESDGASALQLLHQGGDHAGALHFFIACTPNAYYRLESYQDTSLIFGGVDRRAPKIELNPITKEEGVEFLMELINYAYKDDVPDAFPFRSTGVLQLLVEVSQNNLGNLVSLFSRLMERASANGELRVIDYKIALDFLEGEQITAFGGNTDCLDNETFERMQTLLQDQASAEIAETAPDVFQLLLGEQRPFSTDQVATRLGSENNLVQRSVGVINEDLASRESIDRAIIEVKPVTEEASFQDILEELDEYIDNEESTIEIGNFSQSIDELRDRVTHFVSPEQDTSQAKKRLFLPNQQRDLQAFFTGIDLQRARVLENLLEELINTQAEHRYLISDETNRTLFPAPIPGELSFIVDREQRLQLWRDVTQNLSERYDSHMPEAFVEMIKISDNFEVANIEQDSSWNYSRITPQNLGDISIFIYSVNGDVRAMDIQRINRFLDEESPPPHLSLLLYSGEYTDDAENRIDVLELGKSDKNKLLSQRIHPTFVKRLLCAYVASHYHPEEVREEQYQQTMSRWLETEVDFESDLNNWIDEKRKEGAVIEDLEISQSLRDFRGGIKYYINTFGEPGTPTEVFDKNQDNLFQFVPYNIRSPFGTADIESSDKFEDIVDEVQKNGFLDQVNDSKFEISRHRIESRLLDLLSSSNPKTETELKEHFVYLANRDNLLSNIYLDVLEYKGLVEQNDDGYVLSDINDRYTEVTDRFEAYNESLEQNYRIWYYGHIFITKQYDEKYILLRDFDEYICEANSEIQDEWEIADEEDNAPKIANLSRLIDHYEDNLKTEMRNAAEHGCELVVTAQSTLDSFHEDTETIVEKCQKWLDYEIDRGDIVEFQDAVQLCATINKLDGQELSKQQLTQIRESLPSEAENNFNFSQEGEDAFYHNLKIWNLESRVTKLDRLVNGDDSAQSAILDTFDDLDEKESDINSQMQTWTPNDDHIIVQRIFSKLDDIDPGYSGEPISQTDLQLDQIKTDVERLQEQIGDKLDAKDTALDKLEDVQEKEAQFLEEVENQQSLLEHARTIFDTSEFDDHVEKFESTLSEHEGERADLGEELPDDAESLRGQVDTIVDEIEELIEDVQKADSEVQEDWQKYTSDTDQFITRMSELRDIMEEHGANIDEDEFESHVNQIEEQIEPEMLNEAETLLSTIEDHREQLRSLVEETAEDILSFEKFQILEIVLQESRESDDQWVKATEITTQIEQGAEIDPDKITEYMRELVENDYLVHGVTIY